MIPDWVIFNQDGYVNLTFGKRYQVLDHDTNRHMYKLACDDEGQCVWAPDHLFR